MILEFDIIGSNVEICKSETGLKIKCEYDVELEIS